MVKRTTVLLTGAVIAFVFFSIIMTGCVGATNDATPTSVATAYGGRIAKYPVDLGNGVLFFREGSEDNYYEWMFEQDLKTYFTSHPDMKLVTLSSYDLAAYGHTSGYFVVVEKRTTNTCQEAS